MQQQRSVLPSPSTLLGLPRMQLVQHAQHLVSPQSSQSQRQPQGPRVEAPTSHANAPNNRPIARLPPARMPHSVVRVTPAPAPAREPPVHPSHLAASAGPSTGAVPAYGQGVHTYGGRPIAPVAPVPQQPWIGPQVPPAISRAGPTSYYPHAPYLYLHPGGAYADPALQRRDLPHPLLPSPRTHPRFNYSTIPPNALSPHIVAHSASALQQGGGPAATSTTDHGPLDNATVVSGSHSDLTSQQVAHSEPTSLAGPSFENLTAVQYGSVHSEVNRSSPPRVGADRPLLTPTASTATPPNKRPRARKRRSKGHAH